MDIKLIPEEDLPKWLAREGLRPNPSHDCATSFCRCEERRHREYQDKLKSEENNND